MFLSCNFQIQHMKELHYQNKILISNYRIMFHYIICNLLDNNYKFLNYYQHTIHLYNRNYPHKYVFKGLNTNIICNQYINIDQNKSYNFRNILIIIYHKEMDRILGRSNLKLHINRFLRNNLNCILNKQILIYRSSIIVDK